MTTFEIEDKSETAIAGWRRTVERLPLTLWPSLNEQLSRWKLLFPFEQKQLERFLSGAESFAPAELDMVTMKLRAIETKMGVANWIFSRDINSMENSGRLARSEYYGAWRAAVNDLYARFETRAQSIETNESVENRLIVIVLPACLPVDSAMTWDCWQERGRAVTIEGDARKLSGLLWHRDVTAEMSDSRSAVAERWLIDGGTEDVSHSQLDGSVSGSCLNWDVLNRFREKFLADMNSIPRDTHTASEILNALRAQDWSQYWPRDLVEEDRLKDFVIELFLSGNGSLIFSNSFVQWGASEALRRARPKFLMARFSMRSKPKPFIGIAIFENQATVSTVPDVDDPENSAIDAGILARYVWLSALRYPEYERAACLCVAEHLNAAWIVAPPASELANVPGSISAEALHRTLAHWLAT